MPKKQLVAEALIDLHRRLSTLPTRSRERRIVMQETANLYGVSEQTLYRALAQRARPGSGGLPVQILIHLFVGSKIEDPSCIIQHGFSQDQSFRTQ